LEDCLENTGTKADAIIITEDYINEKTFYLNDVQSTLSQSTTNLPVVTLEANATSDVPFNSNITLTWTVSNADSCVASGDWTGNPSVSGGSQNFTITSNQTYILNCTNTNGSTVVSETVNTLGRIVPGDGYVFSFDGDNCGTGLSGSDALGEDWSTSTNYLELCNNMLRFTTSGSGNHFDYVNFNYYLYGDFEVIFDFIPHTYTVPSNGKVNYLTLTLNDGFNYVQAGRIRNNYNREFFLQSNLFTTWTHFEASPLEGASKIRIKREGNDIRAYYWNGAGWEWYGDPNGYLYADNFTTPVKPGFAFEKEEISTVDMSIDNFTIVSAERVVHIDDKEPLFEDDFESYTEGTFYETDDWYIGSDSDSRLSFLDGKINFYSDNDNADGTDYSASFFSKYEIEGDVDFEIDYIIHQGNAPSAGVHYFIRLNIANDSNSAKVLRTRSSAANRYQFQSSSGSQDNIWGISNDLTGSLRIRRFDGKIRGDVNRGSGWEWSGDDKGILSNAVFDGLSKLYISMRNSNSI
jgi:hypothetical protein